MRRVGFILVFACILAISGSARADQQADLQRAREDLAQQDMLGRQRQRYALELRARTPLAEHQMGRIMRLRVEDQQLALHTTISPVFNADRRRADIAWARRSFPTPISSRTIRKSASSTSPSKIIPTR